MGACLLSSLLLLSMRLVRCSMVFQMMYIFHEVFGVLFWDLESVYFSDEV
jgi:hypothetical protein